MLRLPLACLAALVLLCSARAEDEEELKKLKSEGGVKSLLKGAKTGAKLGGLTDAEQKAIKAGLEGAKGEGKGKADLRVEGGKVLYEGRDLDKSISGMRKDLGEAYGRLDELRRDPNPENLKRIDRLESEIRKMEYGVAKYEALRSQALGQGGEGAGSAGQGAGTGSLDALAPPPPPDPGDTRLSRTNLQPDRVGSALSGAGRGAEGFNRSLSSSEDAARLPEDTPPERGDRESAPERGADFSPSGGESEPGAPDPGPGVPKPRNDPGDPRSRQELLLAAMSGFRGSFERLGLRVGNGPSGLQEVLERDGAPASPGRLESLRRDIAAQPRALLQRPDFFAVLPRADFNGLKGAFREETGSREKSFRHVGLSAGARDFLWEKSCDRLSGDCNPHAIQGSYKRDEFVPPETLGSIWQSVLRGGEKEADAGSRSAGALSDPSGAKLAERKFTAGARRGLVERFRGIMRSFFGGSGGSETAAAAAEPPAGREFPSQAGGLDWGQSEPAAFTRNASRYPSGIEPKEVPGGAGLGRGPAPARRVYGRALLWLTVLVSAGLFLGFGLRRLRKASPVAALRGDD